MKQAVMSVTSVLFLSFSVALAASPPEVINYQGVLRDATDKPVEDGDYEMVFRFFDVPETEPGDAILIDTQSVHVTGGLFNATLGLEGNVDDGLGTGDYTTLRQVFGDFPELYLEVEVDGETLAPRMSLAAAGYALNTRLVRGQEIATDGPLTLYVDDTGNDANDGLDPAEPKQTIQAAIDAIPPVLTDDVLVRIGSGTYHERIAIFPRVRTGVHWLHIQGNETFPETVVIDGTGLPPEVEDAPEDGIFVYDLPVRISGVTVQNFETRAITAEFDTYLVLSHCRIVDNLYANEAAVSAGQGGSIELSNCTIANNCIGISASRGGNIDVRDFVQIANNGSDATCGDVMAPNVGVEARSGGFVHFESEVLTCILTNNDMYPRDHSTISRWDRCDLTDSACIESPDDVTGRCDPDPTP